MQPVAGALEPERARSRARKGSASREYADLCDDLGQGGDQPQGHGRFTGSGTGGGDVDAARHCVGPFRVSTSSASRRGPPAALASDCAPIWRTHVTKGLGLWCFPAVGTRTW